MYKLRHGEGQQDICSVRIIGRFPKVPHGKREDMSIFSKKINLKNIWEAGFFEIFGVLRKIQKIAAFDLTGRWRGADTFCELDIHIVVMPMTKGLSHEQKIIPPEDAPEGILCASCARGLLPGVCSGSSSEFACQSYREYAASVSLWFGRK